MSVFAPREYEGSGVQTFREPAALPPLASRHRALARLLVAATEADVAQHTLAAAKSVYLRGPTSPNRDALFLAAADALDKETEFDRIWQEVSHEWFGDAPPVSI